MWTECHLLTRKRAASHRGKTTRIRLHPYALGWRYLFASQHPTA